MTMEAVNRIASVLFFMCSSCFYWLAFVKMTEQKPITVSIYSIVLT